MGFTFSGLNPILFAERERGLKLDGLDPLFLRKEGDSNPRTGFAGYTLSRRASSATRAPFLVCGCKGIVFLSIKRIFLGLFWMKAYFTYSFTLFLWYTYQCGTCNA